MSQMPNLNSPYLLGFDDIERLLERISRAPQNGYPPYNIERIPARDDTPEALRIVLAVAGFAADDLDVTIADAQLTIRGRQSEACSHDYLHRGIAGRQFQRSFVLAEGMEVTSAELENGLLTISLTRPQPQRAARRIKIASRD